MFLYSQIELMYIKDVKEFLRIIFLLSIIAILLEYLIMR